MRRNAFLAAAAVFAASPSQAFGAGERRRGDGYKTIPYRPLDARPYYDPMKLRRRDVDAALWGTVRQINRSGWVWTAESCQGHPGEDAWSAVPEIRLVCRTADVPALLALVHSSARAGEYGVADGQVEDSVLIRRHTKALKPGWSEIRVFAWRTSTGVSPEKWNRAAALGGREYFRRLAAAIEGKGAS